MIARYVGTLSVSPYPDGVTWYLNRPLVYKGSQHTVRVPRGFETDFASVPGIFTNVFPRWGKYGEASVIHDWLYWNQSTTRAEADDVFLEAMATSDVGVVARRLLWSMVRAFGQYAWDGNASIAAAGYSRIRTAASPAQPEWRRWRLAGAGG